jgi:uncharacterized protein YndB with AHSA1/START domain
MKSAAKSVVVIETINAPAGRVWEALTLAEQMEKWYFTMEEFTPEPGFKFSFIGKTDNKEWIHHCQILEVIPEKFLSYTWTYTGVPGETIVSFLLQEQGPLSTLVEVTHQGIGSFPKEIKELSSENFQQGWNYLIKTALKKFVEGNC